MRDRVRAAAGHVPGLVTFIRLVLETVRQCLRYRVTGLAAEGAYFMLLSMPPLVLGLFGGIGYVGGWVGADATGRLVVAVQEYAARFLTTDSIEQLLLPTIDDVLRNGRPDLISVGFVLALWSGSRALNVFVDTISIMYGQGDERGIVRTRLLSLAVYTFGIGGAVVVLPLVLLGPAPLEAWLPDRLSVLASLYWPVVLLLSIAALSTLYLIATPRRARFWRNLPGAVLAFAIWVLASYVVRGVLAASLGGSSIYGPLSTPIIMLIWLYALAIAILIGAALNAATLVLWPARLRRSATSRAIEWARASATRRDESAPGHDAAASGTSGLSGADGGVDGEAPVAEVVPGVEGEGQRHRDQQYAHRERSALAEAIDRELSRELTADAARARGGTHE